MLLYYGGQELGIAVYHTIIELEQSIKPIRLHGTLLSDVMEVCLLHVISLSPSLSLSLSLQC